MTSQETAVVPSKRALRRRVVALEALAVWLAVGVFYLLTLAGNHTEAEDALMYLHDIRSGDAAAISHPYHLAYSWCGWLAYRVALALGYGGGPLLPAQVLNALTGALGIATLWVLLRTAVPGRAAALTGCGLLAFSYGYWWYSVEVEVYILSAASLILCLLLAYRAAASPSWKSFGLLGIAHGLAVLAHNTNVLFVGVVAVALLVAARSLPPGGGVARCVLAYAGAGVAVVVPAYVLAMAASGLETPEEAYGWLTHAAQSDKHGAWEASSLPKAAVGGGRALVGGHFAFSLDPVREVVVGGFSGKSLREELFLVRDYPEGLVFALLVLLAVLAAALLWSALGWLRRRALNRRARLLTALSIAWLAPYALFFTWWEPHNIEFWIAPWVPLAVLFALLSSGPGHGAPRRLPTGLTVVAVLLAVNFFGSVWPQHSPEDDYWRARTVWYERHASAPDLVVAAGAQSGRYLGYFSSARVIDIDTVFPKHDDPAKGLLALRRRIDETDARRVFFSEEVFYPASDVFSRCTEAQLCDEWAPAMRREYMPRTSVVADGRLETVRELDGR